jgi:hypothetical protein
MAPANDGSGVAKPRWWRRWSSSELGTPSTPVSGTCQVFILQTQSGAGSSPGSCLSGGGTETRHAKARLELSPWATAGGGSKDRLPSRTDQTGAVVVVDGRRGTGSIGEGLQRWDDGTTDASRV